MPIYNKAINPEHEHSQFVVEIEPCRSEHITESKPLPKESTMHGMAKGGYTDITKGITYVPDTESAEGRTIRLHEALHVEHSTGTVLHDLLDQGLEDARLHAICSRTSLSALTSPRRDELSVALRDLRRVVTRPVITSADALLALRSFGILAAHNTELDPLHGELLYRALSRFDTDAERRFAKAIDHAILSSGDTLSDHWKAARALLSRYFSKTYSSSTAPSSSGSRSESKSGKPGKPSGKRSKGSSGSTGKVEPSQNRYEDESDTSAPEYSEHESDEHAISSPDESPADADADADTKDTDDAPEDESDASESDSDSEDTGADDSDTESESEGKVSPSTKTSERESSESVEARPESEPEPFPEPGEIEAIKEPLAVTFTKRKPKLETDLYTADLTPDCDKTAYADMARSYPLKLYIRRLDMGINRVKLQLGRRAQMAATTGAKIRASKLVSAITTPGARPFSRPINEGGFGTILIDASGSMSLPPAQLNDFLSKAPALTLAFYNAEYDHWEPGYGGNIFIYAANGYRANIANISRASRYDSTRDCYVDGIKHFGGGNLIDYQAIAWLIKQPAPRFIVTDRGWTGPWDSATDALCAKLERSKVITVVRNLSEMQKLIDKKGRKGTW